MRKTRLAVTSFLLTIAVTAPAAEPPTQVQQRGRQQDSIVGLWSHSVDGGPETKIRLHANGTIHDPGGAASWSLSGRKLVLRWPHPDAPGGVWIDTCQLSEDGQSYAGRNQSGHVVRGTRTSNQTDAARATRQSQGPAIDRRMPDPAIIGSQAPYYVFATGPGCAIWRTGDLQAWTRVGRVFDNSVPAWTREIVPKGASVWAPDIRFVDGMYYLFYSVSTMGSQRSVIGLATNSTLNDRDPSYKWHDRGLVVQSSPERHDYNAIDPALFVDDDASTYLFWGSYWSGIRAAAIDLGSGKLVSLIFGVARRRADATPSIEAPYVMKHDGMYYLFVSWGTCCEGTDSTYKVMVGRADSPQVPFVNDTGRSMNDGGGTLVLMGDSRWRGPGHNSVLQTPKGDWLVHHVIDAEDPQAGRVIQVRPIKWIDGWPVVGRPLGVAQPSTRTSLLVGRWIHCVAEDEPRDIFFEANGTISGVPGEARWEQQGNRLRLTWKSADAPDGNWIDQLRLSEDGRSYTGKNQIGLTIRGTQRQRSGKP